MVIFVENPFKKGHFSRSFDFRDVFHPQNKKNKAIFEFLVKKYVDIGGSEFFLNVDFSDSKRRKSQYIVRMTKN